MQFLHANAEDVTTIFEKDFFSFIYMFNVIYAVKDKPLLLEKLYRIAKPGAILALFEYTKTDTSFDLKDLANRPMYPIVISELEKDLKEAGWGTLSVQDLSLHFLQWYQSLLAKIEKEKETLLLNFPEADIEKVKTTFNTISKQLKTSELGGAVIYAKKSS